MNLIQFVNRHDETVEQGDVVVVGARQSQASRGLQGEILLEVDLTDAAYDTHACGVVASLHAEVRLDPLVQLAEHLTEEIEGGASEPGGAEAAEGAGGEGGDAAAAVAPKGGKGARRAGKAEMADDAGAPAGQTFTPEEFEALDHTRVGPGQSGFMVVLGTCDNCKVDADIAPVKVGDLLTTSPTRGHAQKVLDPSKATGAIIGKALGALKKGKGRIPVLVTLQ